MKLDRYILRELAVPFLIGTISVVLMFQANVLIFFFKTFSASNVPFVALVKYLIYKTPFYLNMTFPVGMALAASLAMSRLTRESELTAMRAAGAPILRVMVPLAFAGILVGLLNFYVGERLVPRGEKAASKLGSQLGMLGAIPDFKSNVSINIQKYSANFGSVAKGPNNTIILSKILLIERPNESEIDLYTFDSGVYEKGNWNFGKGFRRAIVGEDLMSMKATSVHIYEPINLSDLYQPAVPTEQSTEELLQGIREGKSLGRDTAPLEVSYYTRYSVPAACLVFAIVGPIFAIWLGRGGGFVGVLLSILMVVLYYNVYVISTEIFGRNGWLSPWLAAWLADIIFLVLGVVGLRRLE